MAAIASPCVKICTLEPVGYTCVGCDRTMDEIGRWGGMTEAERAAIMALLPERRRRREARERLAQQAQQQQ